MRPSTSPIGLDSTDALRRHAAALIGAPFRHRGRGPDAYDCWGLARTLYRQTWGLELPDYDADGSPEHRARAAALVGTESCRWIEIAKGTNRERAGDLVLMLRYRRPLHIGVALGGKRMIHADEPEGVTAPRYDGPLWWPKVLGFHRHPDLA